MGLVTQCLSLMFIVLFKPNIHSFLVIPVYNFLFHSLMVLTLHPRTLCRIFFSYWTDKGTVSIISSDPPCKDGNT